MSLSRLSLHVQAALVVAVLVAPPLAVASPVGCDATPTPDGKVFPEPLLSVSYVSFAEFECGIATLEAAFPDVIETTSLGTSEGGHAIYDVLMTDETVTADKRHLFVMSSIHGNEFGAREGAVRMIEEMADPDLNGSDEMVQQVLDEFVIHWVFSNPDGWVNGEPHTNEGAGVAYTRANANGFDLNRNFPVQGWFAYDNPEYFQSEGHAVADLMREHAGDWYLGTDNHGQLADGYLAAGLQIVGQFDYQKSETLARFADGISSAMGEYLSTAAFYDVEQIVGEYAGAYHWGTLYDILGYSASGSGIDYYNTPGEIEGTGFATELSYANQQGASQFTYFAPLNQIWTDSVRAINYTMFRQAIDPVEFTYELPGEVGYLFDPERIRHDDENGVGNDLGDPGGFGQAPYDVSRMQFFVDLAEDADHPVRPVRVGEVLDGTVDLHLFDSLVIANDALPEPIPGELGDRETWVEALRTWVTEGGNLVLTDAALEILPDLVEGIDPDDVQVTNSYVGSVEAFTDRDHPLNAGLRGVASQTFDTVPIGMRFGGGVGGIPIGGDATGGDGNVAPNWEVDQAAWEAAGGVTAGTHSSDHAVHGEITAGEGRIGILGALLPDPTEDHYHPFGLQNYAVTYTGYTLLQNHLDWSNPAQVEGTLPGEEPAPEPTPEPDPEPDPEPTSLPRADDAPDGAPLPATGGGRGAALFAVLTAVALGVSRRSRTA